MSAVTSFQTNSNAVQFAYDSIDEAFPKVDPGRHPLGHNILVQVRQPKLKTKGGIIMTEGDRSTEHYNTRVAKVIECGAICFSSTHTADNGPDQSPRFSSYLSLWPEGAWFKVGDFVEIPQYGGSRFVVPFKVTRNEFDFDFGKDVAVLREEEVTFAFFRAKDILALITSDPLMIKSYLD